MICPISGASCACDLGLNDCHTVYSESEIKELRQIEREEFNDHETQDFDYDE